MRILKLSILLAALLGAVGPVWAQVGQAPSPAQLVPAPSAPTYQGPGNAVSGVVAWYSCARAVDSTKTAGTSLCELVDSAAPTTVICTLKLGANGFVDLASTANCTGGVTPTTKCAAATGGVCQPKNRFQSRQYRSD